MHPGLPSLSTGIVLITQLTLNILSHSWSGTGSYLVQDLEAFRLLH